ncbi:MAG TPA: bifunctional nicotinamidase/pyrazinamidase [Spirochaetia bacterium]|nr:bifunctional nicotinamidase/pyrazinamidase [Spirochaetia bacterium]
MPKDSKVKRALVVVDVQNDFCAGGSLPVPEGDRVVPVINRLMPLFPLVVATRDWHPGGHVSFASSHPGKRPTQSVKIDGIEQLLWPDHCVRGSEGANFHPNLDLRPVNLILNKGTRRDLDSYSAFFENDRKTTTGLEFYLKGLGYSEVFLCGLAEDVCVFYSASDAKRLDFRTFVVADAVRGVDIPAGSLGAARRKMESDGVLLVTSDFLHGRY